MSSMKCICPLCKLDAAASDIDSGNRARVYCERCTPFDVTRRVSQWLRDSPTVRREQLSAMAKAAPEGKLLVLTYGEQIFANYENREPKVDRPAPDWLREEQ